MGLSCLENKNFLIFFPKKPHSEKISYTFQPSLEIFPRKKFLIFFPKKPSLKKFLIFLEMGLSSPKIKKFLILSQKKLFFIFQEMELFKKTSYISRGKFPSSKNKNLSKICLDKVLPTFLDDCWSSCKIKKTLIMLDDCWFCLLE